TWSVLSGSLPPGITLQGPGETLASTAAPGFMFLTGRAMQVGDFSFTLKLTDSAPSPVTVTKPFIWHVSELSSQYNSLPLGGTSLVVNTPYTQSLLAIGGTGSYTFTALNSMPAGLALSPSGVVSGTPTAIGTVNVSVNIVDSANHSLTQ